VLAPSARPTDAEEAAEDAAEELMLASDGGHWGVVEVLLGKGASIDLQDTESFTLRMAARAPKSLSNQYTK